MEISIFIKFLKSQRKLLSKQQYRTLKGQAKAGDVQGANKGLQKLLRECKKV